MKLFLVVQLLLLPVLFSNCDSEDSDKLDPIIIEWTIGTLITGPDVLTVTEEFIAGNNDLKIDLTTNSLCENSGVEIVVKVEEAETYSETVSSFPFSTSLDLEEGSNISIKTSIVNLQNSSIVCVWLGNVECKIEY